MEKRKFIISTLCFGFIFFALFQTSKAAIRTVDTTSDVNLSACNNSVPNDCSLRGAASGAASGDTINFDPGLNGSTITLGSIISISFKGLNIVGPGADKLTISGNNTTKIIEFLQSFAPIAISGVTFANGNGVGGFNGNSGGAMEINNCPSITLNGVVFRNNSALGGNGALLCLSTVCRISNSTFTGNTAPRTSAANFVNSPLEMTNTTVSGNTETTSNWYGALLINGSATIRNSTIVNNPGTSNIFVAGPLRLGNSIVTGHPSNDIWRGSGGTVVSEGSNIISRNFNVGSIFPTGSPNANGDYVSASGQMNPQLAPLANYGGPTPTHALLSNSPALDHGKNCVVDNSCATPLAAPLTTDQRGAARQTGAQVDIGAFERNVTFDQNSLPNGTVQHPYNQQITVARQLSDLWPTGVKETYSIDNLAPFTFETVPPSGATGLPPGLVLESNGQLHGAPTTVGTYGFFVKATDQADGMAGVLRYTITIVAPTAANVPISGRVLTPDGRGLPNARVILTDSNGISGTAYSNSFGYYRFNEVAVGETYVFTVSSKGYRFSPRIVNILEEISELNFSAIPE